ncbi:MAG TPA: hypothetical protein VK075_02915 [Pseudogracilibacillus sp.]|nr:hypothetical protein [Pseudogracilibacillus sp.]
MSDLQFFIRHQQNFLRDKMILVFDNDETRDFFKEAIPNCTFEEVSAQSAQYAARIGINGKVITYGYTSELTDEEMDELSNINWERTAQLLAEGNNRLYRKAKLNQKK